MVCFICPPLLFVEGVFHRGSHRSAANLHQLPDPALLAGNHTIYRQEQILFV
jgi:hypothetical protein